MKLFIRFDYSFSLMVYFTNIRWNFEENTPPANFNRFPVALLTVFQVSFEFLFLVRIFFTLKVNI